MHESICFDRRYDEQASRIGTLRADIMRIVREQEHRVQGLLTPTKWEEGACNVGHDQAKWPAGRVERHGRVGDAIEKLSFTHMFL
jgi:hypothetical protein